MNDALRRKSLRRHPFGCNICGLPYARHMETTSPHCFSGAVSDADLRAFAKAAAPTTPTRKASVQPDKPNRGER